MEIKIEIGLIIGWLVMFTLMSAIILISLSYRTKILKTEKEKQILSFKAVIEAEEKLKESIANNLHDEVIPILTAMQQNIKQHKKDLISSTIKAEEFDKDSEIIEQNIKAIRAIALNLIPTTFLNFGLLKALEQYAAQLNKNNKTVEFESEMSLEQELPFSKNEQINIYRICMEIINNLGKHSVYTCLSINFKKTENQCEFQFVHDGTAISNEEIESLLQSSTGLGLKSLKSRTLMLNASINYVKNGNVPAIHLIIPFKK